ncbi:hypothetical protein LTR37_004641 [Vermiconidia calcicola]|uniref:Uncharacterized protein n=1 Tax=Vermiconidia calcicola TaxID=1690605 RepID=A0ACC3NLE0_9PEZI|nr:hypothetical protein LTR37_004641 [Vermiconidia calcicola]
MPTIFDVKDKVIAITGGSGGIGFATAQLLVSQGAKVSIADVSETALEEADSKLKQAQYPGEFMTTAVDVRKPQEVNEWIRSTVDKFGRLDGAANMAAVIPKNINIDRVEDMPDEDWQFVIDVNLSGVMHCMRAELRQMNEKGSIINASSVAGIAGFAKNSAYVATKHAVIGLSRSAAKEVGDRGIRVNCICPGVIDTPMSRKSNETRGGADLECKWQIKRKGQPEEVAQLIAWLLCDGSSFITGTVQVIDGGYIC